MRSNIHHYRRICALFAGGALSCGGLGGVDSPSTDGLEPWSDAFQAIHPLVYQPPPPERPWIEDPGGLHDHLSHTFTGEALTEAYIDHLLIAASLEESGTRLEIIDVNYLGVSTAPDPEGGAWVDARWTVSGEVHHTRHTHGRVNRYHGRFHLLETEVGPRIDAVMMGSVGGTVLPAGELERLKKTGEPGLSPSEILQSQGGGDGR